MLSEEFCSSSSVSCVFQMQYICVVCEAGVCRIPCKGYKMPAVPREWEFSTEGSVIEKTLLGWVWIRCYFSACGWSAIGLCISLSLLCCNIFFFGI